MMIKNSPSKNELRVLVLGFEPFLHHRTNISGELAIQLHDLILESQLSSRRIYKIHGLRMPVSYDVYDRFARNLISEVQPHFVWLFGLSETRAQSEIELVALNKSHGSRQDSQNILKSNHTIRKELPLALQNPSLEIEDLETLIQNKNLNCGLSWHAGTYVCNTLYFEFLAEKLAPGYFVHMPHNASSSSLQELMIAVMDHYFFRA